MSVADFAHYSRAYIRGKRKSTENKNKIEKTAGGMRFWFHLTHKQQSTRQRRRE